MGRGPGREHQEIRRAILGAAKDLAAASGVEALTFRGVAAAAGVSPGRVQHYFTDRATLVRACFDELQSRVRERVQTSLIDTAQTPAAVVAAVLHAMIPSTPEEVTELRAVSMFETLALTEPSLERALGADHAALRDLLVTQVAAARTSASSTDRAGAESAWTPELVGHGLLAVAEGLADEVVHARLAAAEARRILDSMLSSGLGTSLVSGSQRR